MTSESESHAAGEHHAGPGRYGVVLSVLVALTVLTVITGKADLGAANLPLALCIAGVKASLVVLFFMHMLEAEAMNKIVFVVSVFFLILLVLGSFGDLGTRSKLLLPVPGERFHPIDQYAGHGTTPESSRH